MEYCPKKGNNDKPAIAQLTYSPGPQDFGVHMTEFRTGVRDPGNNIGEVLRILNVG